VRILEQHKKQYTVPPLPPVFPLLFYHGKTGWKIHPSFQSLFDCPDELKPYLPEFRYHIVDLSQYRDEDLQHATVSAILKSAMLSMKHIQSSELPYGLLFDIFKLLSELMEKKTGLEYFETLLKYLVTATDKVDADTLKTAIESALPGKGDTIMPTIAERWIEQGVQRGLQKGRVEGRVEGMQQGMQQGETTLLIHLWEHKFGP